MEVVDTDLLPIGGHSVVPVSTKRGQPEKPIVILKLGKGQVRITFVAFVSAVSGGFGKVGLRAY